MLIGILKVTRVPSPEGVLGGFYDGSARSLSMLHNRIDFGFGRNIVSNRELRSTRLTCSETCIMSEAFAWPEGELESILQVKENDCAMFEFLSDYALRL
jgi:hypothetical protein